MKNEILSVKEKIGYGMGDAASHIIFDNVMLYMIFSIPISSVYLLVLSAPCFYWRGRWMPSPTPVWA